MVISNLAVLAYAKGFTLWLYKTGRTLEFVQSAGYFADGAGMFEHGDVVMIAAADGSGWRQFFVDGPAVTLRGLV